MVFELEAIRKQLLQSPGAAGDVEDAVAHRAVEVVVMGGGDAREFVAIRPARHRDGRDLVLIPKSPHHPIHRPEPKAGDRGGSFGVNFRDGERTARDFDRFTDRHGLPGGALLGHGVRLGGAHQG